MTLLLQVVIPILALVWAYWYLPHPADGAWRQVGRLLQATIIAYLAWALVLSVTT